jgi:hypothetical protein
MRGTEAGMMLLAVASVVRKWLVAPESRMAYHLMVAALVVMVLRRAEAACAYLWLGVGRRVKLTELTNLLLPTPACQITLAAAGWWHCRAAGWVHSWVPSWPSPVGPAAASLVQSWRLEGIAGRQNSSWFGRADAPAWSWSSVGVRCRRQVAFLQTVRVGQSCLGLGSMTLVGVAVGTAAAGGNNWGVECSHAPTVGWSCAFGNQSAHDVGTGCVRIVCRAPIPTRCACVPFFNVTTMR